jgi:hypothetical protein
MGYTSVLDHTPKFWAVFHFFFHHTVLYSPLLIANYLHFSRSIILTFSYNITTLWIWQPQRARCFSMSFSTVSVLQNIRFCFKWESYWLTFITTISTIFTLSFLGNFHIANYIQKTLKKCTTRKVQFHNKSWRSKMEQHLFLLIKNVDHNVGHTQVYWERKGVV